MIFDIDHPMIVKRRKRSDDEPGFALVRSSSRVDVPDYADGDVGTAVIMHHANASTLYRKIGSHFYKEMSHMPAKALSSGTDMMESLIGRETMFDFTPFMACITDFAAEHSEGFDLPVQSVAYLHRNLSRQESRTSSYSPLLKAFHKAPSLGNQLWLDRGYENDRLDWQAKFSAFMENVAIVDGIVHVRCFEPAIVMRLGRGDRYIRYGKLSYMEERLGAGRRADRLGIPHLGKGGDETTSAYFSFNEYDRAVSVAEEHGCANEVNLDAVVTGYTIVDTQALSNDFLLEDTYRAATQALRLSNAISNDLALDFYADRSQKQTLARRLAEISEPEDALVKLVSPITVLDADLIGRATSVLVAALRRDGEFLAKNNAGALSQLENTLAFLETRSDAMPISVPTRAFALD